ncbi:B12-binding domain-containing protein [candidate division CSSED10-310 bacterium]|uniref:B12-binding domain-containing protein n=1 Tax=candidate division CSSED10-310 bacterium TaxID=2855610 RepID=A0ABV6YXU7_UNCC1
MIAEKIDTSTYLSSLISGMRGYCTDFALSLAQEMPVIDLYEGLFRPTLYQVGELWEYNRISVATEHLATSITESIMNQLYHRIISPQRVNKRVVVTCVEGEQHQVGAKMVADVFEMHGWDSYFLGANTPTSELIRFIREVKPQLVALSLSIYFHLPELKHVLNILNENFPNLNIMIGGQAFNHVGNIAQELHSQANYFSDLKELDTFLKS